MALLEMQDSKDKILESKLDSLDDFTEPPKKENGSALLNAIFKPEEILEEQEVIKNSIRRRASTFGKQRKVVRFTREQLEETRQAFKLFIQLMQRVEEKLAEREYNITGNREFYYLFEEFAPFLHAKNALRDVSRSMLACFQCGEIIPHMDSSKVFVKIKDGIKTPFHICEVFDEENNIYKLGEAERTNWMNIYSLMIENKVFKHLMRIVSESVLGEEK